MTRSVDEITDAVLVAVERGRVHAERAQQLMGQLLLDAAGASLGPDEGWRAELVRAGVDRSLVDRAHSELRALTQWTEGSPEFIGSTTRIDRLLEHAAVLGEPSGWAKATTYDSLALALIDSVWSPGVRYTGVRHVLDRYREARSQEGANGNLETRPRISHASSTRQAAPRRSPSS